MLFFEKGHFGQTERGQRKDHQTLPDIRPLLISGILPDIRFRLPDIRLAGYPARKTLHGIFFLQNLGLH